MELLEEGLGFGCLLLGLFFDEFWVELRSDVGFVKLLLIL
jgi:hypothetical protein